MFCVVSCQVLEMDGLLRNHQADTAAHQLQLERNFAHKHAELRGRTQELEETVIKLEESRRKENDLKQIVESLKNSMAALKKEKDEDIGVKVSFNYFYQTLAHNYYLPVHGIFDIPVALYKINMKQLLCYDYVTVAVYSITTLEFLCVTQIRCSTQYL